MSLISRVVAAIDDRGAGVIDAGYRLPGLIAGIFSRSAGSLSASKVSTFISIRLTNGQPKSGLFLAASIDNHTDGGNDSAVRAHDIDRLLDAAAARHDILGHDKAFAFVDLESAPQNESAGFFFDKNVTLTERSPNFLADDNSAKRRRDDCVAVEFAQSIGQHSANAGGDVGILKKQRALEILPAVQAGAQNEMAVEQRAGFAKESEKIF